MQRTFICQGCNRERPGNPKLKGNQRYCGAPACQRARKAAWQKEKMASDAQYRAEQIACLARWRKKRPLDQYQRRYRSEHPAYMLRNRLAQAARNRKRDLIVKMDALRTSKSNLCLLTLLKRDRHKKIVKMDAFAVELSFFPLDNRPVLAAVP